MDKFELRVFRRTSVNMATAIELAERSPSREYHILVNKTKIALITHFTWETCEYCNCGEDERGIINLEK